MPKSAVRCIYKWWCEKNIRSVRCCFFYCVLTKIYCRTFSINLTKKSLDIFYKYHFSGAALTFFSLVEGLYFSIFSPSLEGNIKLRLHFTINHLIRYYLFKLSGENNISITNFNVIYMYYNTIIKPLFCYLNKRGYSTSKIKLATPYFFVFIMPIY